MSTIYIFGMYKCIPRIVLLPDYDISASMNAIYVM